MRIILASSSPRRRQLFASIVPYFEIIKPHIEEIRQPDEAPMEYALRLSREKVQAVAAAIEGDAAILAADTIVILAADTIGIAENGDILEKPASAEMARQMLTRLRNRPHLVCTAFTVQRGEAQRSQIVTTKVLMRNYSDAEMEAYIATGDPFDKAGSYAIQHEGFRPVAKVEGSRSNVVGLPAEEVRAALQAMGVPTLTE